MANTVKANDVEVYEHDIYIYADEYIATLDDVKDLKNIHTFAGMIKHISLKINITKKQLEDIVLLNHIWQIYTSLCYKYSQNITIERYCILINISRETYYSWIKGVTRDEYNEVLNVSRSDVCKKWAAECESSWQDAAGIGNPGAMFVLKARHGWQETATQEVIHTHRIEKSAEQIAQDYDIPLIETTTI